MATDAGRLTTEESLEPPSDHRNEVADGPLRALLPGTAMDGAQIAGNLVVGLEVFRVRRTLLNRLEVRHAAQRLLTEAVGRPEWLRWKRPDRATHEVGPDGQRHAASVCV